MWVWVWVCIYTYRYRYISFPGGSAGKESACNAGDLGSGPGLERSPGEGNGYPLQYSGLENSMDRGALQATYIQPMRLQRVGHNWATNHITLTYYLVATSSLKITNPQKVFLKWHGQTDPKFSGLSQNFGWRVFPSWSCETTYFQQLHSLC